MIKYIEIELADETILKLTLKEARELYNELKLLFPDPIPYTSPWTTPIKDTDPFQPYKVTWTDTTENQTTSK
mgnify:CR=1 FL=1